MKKFLTVLCFICLCLTVNSYASEIGVYVRIPETLDKTVPVVDNNAVGLLYSYISQNNSVIDLRYGQLDGTTHYNNFSTSHKGEEAGVNLKGNIIKNDSITFFILAGFNGYDYEVSGDNSGLLKIHANSLELGAGTELSVGWNLYFTYSGVSLHHRTDSTINSYIKYKNVETDSYINHEFGVTIKARVDDNDNKIKMWLRNNKYYITMGVGADFLLSKNVIFKISDSYGNGVNTANIGLAYKF